MRNYPESIFLYLYRQKREKKGEEKKKFDSGHTKEGKNEKEGKMMNDIMEEGAD